MSDEFNNEQRDRLSMDRKWEVLPVMDKLSHEEAMKISIDLWEYLATNLEPYSQLDSEKSYALRAIGLEPMGFFKHDCPLCEIYNLGYPHPCDKKCPFTVFGNQTGCCELHHHSPYRRWTHARTIEEKLEAAKEVAGFLKKQ